MCQIEGCDKPAWSRGWCHKHYSRWQRHGDPLATARNPPMADGVGLKLCPRCDTLKPVEEYGLRPNGKPKGYCKPCQAEYDAEYALRKAGREARRRASVKWSEGPRKDYDLRRFYGITLVEYEEMCERQGNRCAICGTDRPGGKSNGIRWTVDHCHVTGRTKDAVRGLLCTNCNHGLGKFKDDPELLRAAAAYLECHRTA